MIKQESKKIVVVGGGGHGKVVIELIRCTSGFEIVGILDPQLKKGSEVLGVKVLGDDSQLPALKKNGVQYAAIGVGSTDDNTLRNKIFTNVRLNGFKLPAFVHSTAYMASEV